MKRWILISAFLVLGAGCGDSYVSGAPSTGSPGVVTNGSSVGMSAIVAPDLKPSTGNAFTLPQ